ncbi:hypothetical protein ClosIBUN22A_CONTIG169g03525 [Clostridium sp. IBUN22A]|nr:hypothetical protein ClosIBUN22A_CONTIG169g03525 [Clostridium sp. IBUN22A]
MQIILFFLGILLNEVIVMKKRFFILVSLLIAFTLLYADSKFKILFFPDINHY